MIRKVVGALGALSLSTVALLGAGSTAQAQDSAKDAGAGDFGATATCASVSMCLFQHDDFGGSKITIPALTEVKDLRGWSFDNKASSMANLSGREVRLHVSANFGGAHYLARASSTDKDFTDNGFDNKASSVDWQ